MYETNQEQLSSALAGLSSSHQKIIRNALGGVEPGVIREWLETGALREWISQGMLLLGRKGETEEAQLSSLFLATPTVLATLTPGEFGEWLRMGLDIAPIDSQIFSSLPEGLTELNGAERSNFYRLVRSSAYRSPGAAAALYRSLPCKVQTLPPDMRGALFRCLQAAATFDPEPLPPILPFLGPTLSSLAPESRASLLDRIVQMAQTFPAGVARLFRSLVRAYEEVGEEGVKSWIAAGEAIAERSPQAGEAFFALESRTSLLLLRGSSPAVNLLDIYGVLLKYAHMLCGEAVSIKESSFLSVLPPLAESADDALPLPACIEVFPSYEENFRLYRTLAAQQAGRIVFGTYDFSLPGLWSVLPSFIRDAAHREIAPPSDLASYFLLFPQPDQLEALFLLIENKRVSRRLAETYRGLRDDLLWADSLTHLLPPVLTDVLPRLPNALWRDLGKEATMYDALLLATELHTWIVAPELQRAASRLPAAPGDAEAMGQGEATESGGGEGDGEENHSSLSAEQQEMLRKILDAVRTHGNKKKSSRKQKTTVVVTFDPEAEEADEEETSTRRKKKAAERRLQTAAGLSYFYDEWDFLIEDYRTQWCQVREIPVAGDNGAFFSRTLATYPDLVEEIKREFQRLRPRLYRHVKGLEDGETIDLDAAVTARVDWLSGIAPSPKLYVARQPLERDVAALFLLDLSASTDAQLAERDGVRVIDIMKEALALLSASLETIGDKYAILGFSSRGRRDVEIYPVKTFTESLSSEVRGRIGGLSPQKSTRMGAAVRHATRKLRELSCRAKFLVLLSDGHPEDADYGPSAQAPTYGVRDTMMALREAEQNGVLSFCLTVDKAGRDYLREMCAPSRYMIIEDPTSLPTELPKIYQRHIRVQKD
ncbi:MAG: nitric oxide reductase activation protein NorD [Candidatus Binatia bacterium]